MKEVISKKIEVNRINQLVTFYELICLETERQLFIVKEDRVVKKQEPVFQRGAWTRVIEHSEGDIFGEVG